MSTFTELENKKEETLAAVRTWSEARLNHHLEAGGWSTIEVLDHIVKVESEITSAARLGLRTPHPIGLRDRLGFEFLDRVFRSARKVKVPRSASSVLPAAHATLSDVTQSWEIARKDLAQLIGDVGPEELEFGLFRHPVSGWMTLRQITRFFSVHIQHHNFQLARLREASQGL